MTDSNPSTTTPLSTTTGTGIPVPPMNMNTTTNPKYHWWYDSKSSGANNYTTSTSLTGHSPPPMNYKNLSKSPSSIDDKFSGGDEWMKSAGANTTRRDSLKNMVHLCDFATP